MIFKRMAIEKESPEQYGYERIKYNLTESSTSDKSLSEVGIKLDNDMLLCYGDHLGNSRLRTLIGKRYDACDNEVITTVGACMALFIVYSTILKANDNLIIMHPNYPANIEIPRSLGCKIELFPLNFEDGFKPDIKKLISMLKPNTRIVSITYPHNPTGTMMKPDELTELMKACERNGTYLLVDETYGDLTVGGRLPHVSSISKYGICVESLSKAIGVPGIRVGWIVTKNSTLLEKFISAKEQICICGSVVDEECAYQVLLNNDQLLESIRKDISEKFAILCNIMENQDVLEWIRPCGGVVCFPRLKQEVNLDISEFYHILNEKYGVFVGPGHWFDMDDRYFRIGYAWPDKEQLRNGLLGLIDAVKEARR